MFSAVAALVLGVISVMGAVVPIPVVLPVFGLILGINGLIKENKRTKKRKNIKIMCWIGVAMNGLPTILIMIGRLSGI